MDVEGYRAQGVTSLPALFDPEAIGAARRALGRLYLTQLEALCIPCEGAPSPTEEALHDAIARLFAASPQAFLSVLAQAPSLPALARLGTLPQVLDALQALGLEEPILATPPICYFLSEAFALPGGAHRAPPHQDWRYIQGSLDALTLWIPLVDVGPENGAVEILPGSHRRGLLPTVSAARDLSVRPDAYDAGGFEAATLSVGDALAFSAFALHRSGVNPSGRVRWAVAFRYNNLAEPSFVARGLPYPYRFTPELTLQRPGWPEPEDLGGIFPSPP